jgi:zinc transport system substrate-binding protein
MKYLLTLLFLPIIVWAQPNVLVSIKPIHDIATAVMQDIAEPSLLLPPGASPHSYALKPSQARALHQADLIIWVGPDLERFLQKPLAQIDNRKKMTLQNEHELILYPYEGHDHGHSHGVIDPHLWLDPINMQIFAEILALKLALIDPDNAEVYRSNAELVKAELGKLNEELDRKLRPIRGKPFMVFHDAYQYFSRRYHLDIPSSFTINPDLMPSAAQVLAIKQTLKKQGISCIFTEPQFSPAIVQRVAAEANVEYGTLDPIGGPQGTGFTAYALLLQQMADTLSQCLQVETKHETND